MTVIYFKTSHVIVYLQRIRTRHSYPLISKHLMLLFILKDERDELKYMLNDMHSVVDAANDDFFNEMSRLCGCIEIEGTRITAAYQDLVGILLANGYTVEVTPLHNNTRLQVVIKESEDEINE